MTKLRVAEGGLFVVETEDWETYWRPIQELGCGKVEDGLEALEDGDSNA